MAPSSRTSAAGAGWEQCSGCGAWKDDVPKDAKPLSWLRPGTLWRSRNDVIARRFHDPVDAARVRWVRLARERGAPEDFVVERKSGDVSFLVIGDPGEGDDSQYAVVPGLLSQAGGIDFAVICSDLIYPTGDMSDYCDHFYRPYRKLTVPIFGVPGNHDWYDGLQGFMHHICGIDDPDAPLDFGSGIRKAIARRTWRLSKRPTDQELVDMCLGREPPTQPGPYVAIDAGPLRIVTIDTGIRGGIDPEQAAWLERVSLSDPRPKILLTGKPIYVDGEHKDEQKPVDKIVTDPAANYVAAIGGDIHNYQRYPVTLPDGRTIQYVVSGGGGAFMHATHQIPEVDLPGVTEEDFRCYPLRGDSLARYSQLYAKKLRQKWLKLTPHEASSYLARQMNREPTRPGTKVELTRRAEWAGRVIQPLPAGRGFQRFVSEAFDWNDPPMFKSFLRIDATRSEVRIRCFGVSGCREAENTPPVEDEFTIPLN
jgi:Calcineurin-like phosphoesterase